MPAAIFFVRLDLEENTGISLPSVKNYLISGQTLGIKGKITILEAVSGELNPDNNNYNVIELLSTVYRDLCKTSNLRPTQGGR